jgi:hypothetical protein
MPLQGENVFKLDNKMLKEISSRNYKNTIKSFKKQILLISFLKLGFSLLLALEIITFSLFILSDARASILAISLGIIFLSFFSFFIIIHYHQTKKADQLIKLKDRFINSCKQTTSIPSSTAEHHLLLAKAILKLVSYIDGVENSFLNLPYLKIFQHSIKRLSFFLHADDLFKIKEMLLIAAVSQHLEQIHSTPIDLEVHASLANTYLLLAKLYNLSIDNNLSSYKKIKKYIFDKYEKAAKLAIEEYKILNEYAPNDPWVISQLAHCYNSLNMHEKESVEYEKILSLNPDDYEILYRLGVLSFKIGQNAKGLKIFNQLKKHSPKKAKKLISNYDLSRKEYLLNE